jgi:hypothetical protein
MQHQHRSRGCGCGWRRHATAAPCVVCVHLEPMTASLSLNGSYREAIEEPNNEHWKDDIGSSRAK